MSDFDKDWGFECDQCGQTVGGGIYDFDESLELRKQEGWINRKIDGEWYSFCCEDCYKEWIADHQYRPTPRKIHK